MVKIQPVVAHLDDGTDIVEAGVGGGGNDFQRQAELRYMLPQDVIALFQWYASVDNFHRFLTNTAVLGLGKRIKRLSSGSGQYWMH